MDVLSDVVTAMRTGRPHSSRTRKHGRWGIRFAPFAGAGFHVVLQGSCWLPPRNGEPVQLGVGDVVCLPHGRGHGLADSPSTPLVDAGAAPETGVPPSAPPAGSAADPSASTVLLCGAYFLDQARPHPLLTELPEFIHLPTRIGRQTALRTAIDLLGTELDQSGPGTDAVLAALLDMLLLYALRAWYAEQGGSDASSGWAAALADPVVRTALEHMHRDPSRKWTLAGLARTANVSRATLARRFTALAGQPPLAYLTWWRMTCAARRLRATDAPLAAIASSCGYSSEFAFAKAFKREFGMAPGSYRQRGRAGADACPGGPHSAVPPARPSPFDSGRLP